MRLMVNIGYNRTFYYIVGTFWGYLPLVAKYSDNLDILIPEGLIFVLLLRHFHPPFH